MGNSRRRANKWKERECTSCGCTYEVQRAYKSPNLAARAWDGVGQFFTFTTMPRREPPCPECGCVHPDVFSRQKFAGHFGVGIWASVATVVVTATGYLSPPGWLNYAVTGLILAIGSTVGLMFHTVIALFNPNRDMERNLARANTLVAHGVVETVNDPDPEFANGPPRASRPGVVALLTLAVLGVLLMATPFALKATSNWPISPNAKPEVVGPGDTVRVRFPMTVEAVNGKWNGNPRATMTTAGTPGRPVSLSAKANYEEWGEKISGKSVSNQKTTPWADVTIPDDPTLVGKVIEVNVDMDVVYPTSVGRAFVNVDAETSTTQHYTLAERGESAKYRLTFGLAVLGVLIQAGCAVGLCLSANRLRK